MKKDGDEVGKKKMMSGQQSSFPMQIWPPMLQQLKAQHF